MNITDEQYEFFKDLDVSEAVKHSDGRIHFAFPYKGRMVEVQPYRRGDADIVVHAKKEAEYQIPIDQSLSLFDIPETENVSGPALLTMLHEAVHKHPKSVIRETWFDTPYVKRWPVDVVGSSIRFSYQEGSAGYELLVHEAQEAQETTTVVLLVDGRQIHTFLLPLKFPSKITALFVFELANAISTAWRDEIGE